MIRLYQPNDMFDVIKIHEKFYKNEFELPDFSKFVCSFTIVENDKIISIGGVRNILEAIVVTDKDLSPKVRRDALIQMLQAMQFAADKNGHNEIHASIINDETWKRHLVDKGFKPLKGEMLVLSW